MNKLEMAHEYAMQHLKNSDGKITMHSLCLFAWQYADAMQAEADKRTTRCNEKIEINMYPEWDASINYPPDAWVMYRGEKRLAISIKNEWQPDWSQAPDDACCWFIGGSSWDLKAYWSKYIPCYKSETTQTTWQGNGMIEAPSFDYQGDWRDSLRKRPQ